MVKFSKYDFRNLHEMQGATGSKCCSDRAVYRSAGHLITVSFHKDVWQSLGFQKGKQVVVAFDKEEDVFAVRKKDEREVGGYRLQASGSRLAVTFRAMGVFPSVGKPVRLQEIEQNTTTIIFRMPGGTIAR